jgi:aminopeptidase N
MRGVLNQLVYQKGGWVLHMLRGQIGTETFWSAIRDYYTQYRDKNASSADFRAVVEKHSGQNLGWFFDQWLTRAGSPVIDGTWRYDAARKVVVVELKQTQASGAYRLPFEIAITAPGTAPNAAPVTRIEKIELTGATQRFEIASDVAPTALVLDPNTWILMQARFAGS